MVIRLSEIEDALVVKGEMDTEMFTKTEGSELKLVTPVSYELTVRKYDDTVSIEGPVALKALFVCSRCLDEFPLTISIDMAVKLAPKSKLTYSPETELHSDDLDVYYYEGDELDLDPYVYDEIMLNVPVRPLCREECKGICAVCGKNMNSDPCNCHDTPSTLLGEKLKSFLN